MGKKLDGFRVSRKVIYIDPQTDEESYILIETIVSYPEGVLDSDKSTYEHIITMALDEVKERSLEELKKRLG